MGIFIPWITGKSTLFITLHKPINRLTIWSYLGKMS
jgi:hypothetical protein